MVAMPLPKPVVEAGTVARETPLWQAWLQERFPMPTEPSKSE